MMEDPGNVFQNDMKEVHSELARISHNFEEAMDRVQRNHEEYIRQLKIINTAIQKAVASPKPIIVNSAEEPLPSVEDRKTLGGQGGEDTHDGVEESSSLEEQNEKIIVSDLPIVVNSAKEPLPSVEDQKTLGGQAPLEPINVNLTDELVKIFEQVSLKQPTFERFKLFGVAIFAENKLLAKPFNALVFVNLNPHWLCGAHQKMALIWWLFEQQHYYQSY